MLSRSLMIRRSISSSTSKQAVDALKKRLVDAKVQSQPYVEKLGKQMDIAKKKSIVGFNSLCVWISSVFNKVTGYDQITELESRVTVSERVFENTTQSLRELNTEYLNHEQRVMELQMERTELMLKPKRTAEENKRLAELVASENDWESPLETVRKEYFNLFDLQKKQLEEYKDNIYKRYYEERAWEQKIRRLGQYSYIAMLMLNVMTFMYTRYDRKRIRLNMQSTIDSNEALSLQVTEMEAAQKAMMEENQQLLVELKSVISEVKQQQQQIGQQMETAMLNKPNNPNNEISSTATTHPDERGKEEILPLSPIIEEKGEDNTRLEDNSMTISPSEEEYQKAFSNVSYLLLGCVSTLFYLSFLV